MPIFGTLDVAPLLEAAPRMSGLDAEPWETPGVEILQLLYEIDDREMAALLPRALHPTIPPVVTFVVSRYPDSPFGAFTIAQVRAGCRAGTRPRGYLLRAYCDSQRACDELAARWGFDCRRGEVRLQRYHDRIVASVTADTEILRAALVDPEPIAGGDIQYVASMHLARLASEGDRGILVQVDPEFRILRAERGRPDLATFARDAWGAAAVEPVYPVIASFAVCDTGLPRIRYLLDPDQPAYTGTRQVAG